MIAPALSRGTVMSFLMVIFFLAPGFSFAQTPGPSTVRIGILTEDQNSLIQFRETIKQEITYLLENRFNTQWSEAIINPGAINDQLDQWYDQDLDLLLVIGLDATEALYRRADFPVPTIGVISLRLSDSGDPSGIPNFTFLESPFSVPEDLERFRQLVPFRHLCILAAPSEFPIKEQVEGLLPDSVRLTVRRITESVEDDLNALPDDVDAAYLFPLLYNSDQQDSLLLEGLHERKIPTFAMVGRPVVEEGAFAGKANANYLNTYARTTAVAVLRILDGEDPATFNTQVPGVEDEFVVNVATMRTLEIYPPISVLAEALLLNLNTFPNARTLNLKGTLLEAMQRNLDIRIAEQSVANSDQQIRLAQSNFLPQVDVNTTAIYTNPDIARASAFTDELVWNIGGSLSQLIYSEPAYANLAISKYLKQVEVAGLDQQKLDIYQQAISTYLNYLLAQTNVEIQQRNVDVTLQNLNFAKTKRNIGQSSAADIYRLEAEIANANINLNESVQNVQLVKFQLNALLNQPNNTDIQTEDVPLTPEYLLLANPVVSSIIKNQYQIQQMADYLVNYAFDHTPSLQQLAYNVQIAERILQSDKRRLYLPQVTLGGGYSKAVGRYLEGSATTQELQILGPIVTNPYQPTWQVQVGVSLPIFQGFARKANIQSSTIELEQLQTQSESLKLQLEAGIRSNLTQLANAYGDYLLSEESNAAATQYLGIIQNVYREGSASLTNLLEAQTNAIAAQSALVAAKYELLLQGISLEVLIGFPNLLATPSERGQFIDQLVEQLLRN